MSGPSATEKPMSAKIAMISSITWLIGWMRPVSTPGKGDGQRHVERLALELRLKRRRLSAARRAASASVT